MSAAAAAALPRLVDEGKNPDVFTEKRIDEASYRLQATNGKIAAFQVGARRPKKCLCKPNARAAAQHFKAQLIRELQHNGWKDEYERHLAGSAGGAETNR